ncbi:hypothetical protein Tco_1429013 [Tanacetum coccineum]
MESLNSNSHERELHPLQQMQDKAKKSCMVSFRLLHSHLTALSNNELKGTSIEGGFERAFATIIEQDVQTFTRTMFANLDQLEKHLSKEEFQELESSSAFRYLESLRESIQERAKHKREYDRRMNDRMIQSKEGNVDSSKALDDGLVVTESNETESERHVSSSRSGKDTHAEDADINSVNDKQPMAEIKSSIQKSSKPDTPSYFPNFRESAPAKPHHVNAPSSSRNSQKESYGSNDMAHNYYLEEAKKKTQDKNRNLKPREMPSANTHHTPNTYTPKPRSINHKSRNWPASKSNVETLKAVQKTDHSRNPSLFSYSKHFVCSTCQKCIFNANHDACITKFLKEVNSRAKIQPNKTRNSNKPVVPMSHTQKPGWKIVTGHSFSPNKIFNTVGLKWVPTGKTFTSSTTKVDCEPPNGSNECITNSYDCDQTLNVSAGPALHEMTPTTISSGLMSNPPPLTPFVPPSRTDWDILFQPLFDELLTPLPSVDHPTPKFITPIAEVVAPEPPASTEVNHDLDIAHMNNDPFFGIPIPENDCEASSSSDVIPTIVQSAAPYSEHVTKWTKDYPLDNIIGELERPVSTRLQLHEQALFCYYDAFLLSVEPKTYKDALIMLD